MRKVVFYLLGKKGYHVLRSYIKKYSSEKIEYVVLAKDKNINKDYYIELQELCKEYSVQYFDRLENIEDFSGYKFAIGWRWIIDDIRNLIILHDSLLPKYRGFSPLVNMLINGETKIGVTALNASQQYDEGKIIKQESLGINYPIKIVEAIDLISEIYAALVNDICSLVFNDEKIIGIPQIEENASYSLWRDERDYVINWKFDSQRIKRLVDAVGYPFNGATTLLNNEKVIINDVELYSDLKIENRDAGKVIFINDEYPVVVCGKGLLKIKSGRFLDNCSILPLRKFRSRFGGLEDDTV